MSESLLKMEAILASFLNPDNNVRKAAEHEVLTLLKRPESIVLFMEVICTSKEPLARQLAATLLRKKISLLWRKLDASSAQRMKEQLIICLHNKEDKRATRWAVAHLSALVSKLCLGNWKELLECVGGFAGSDVEEDKELAMVLMTALVETMPDVLLSSGNLSTCAGLILHGLNDSRPTVSIAAGRAAANLVSQCKTGNQLNTLQHVIERNVQVLCQLSGAVEKEQVDVLMALFDMIDEVVTVNGVSGDLVQRLIGLSIEVAVQPSVKGMIRERAMMFLSQAVSCKPKMVQERNLLDDIIRCALQLMAENHTEDLFSKGNKWMMNERPSAEDEEDSDDEEEEDVCTPMQMGFILLGDLHNGVKPGKLYSAASRLCAEAFNKGVAYRRASILGFASLSEGCREKMREDLANIINMMDSCMKDDSEAVKQAAAYALSVFVEYLQPEILEQSDFIIRHVKWLLQDPHPSVREKACFMLDSVAEDMGIALLEHLPELMTRLRELISTSDIKTQSHCIAAIGSLASGLEEKFVESQNVFEILHLIRNILEDPRSKQIENVQLRAQATETLGVLWNVGGFEIFSQSFEALHKLVIENMDSPSAELQEATFRCFSNIAELLSQSGKEKDVVDFINSTLPVCVEVIGLTETELTSQPGVFGASGSGFVMEANSDDEDGDDGGSIGGEKTYCRVRTADAERKAAALRCVGVFAKAAKEKFPEEHFESCLSLAKENMMSNIHDKIKEDALHAYSYLCVSLFRKFGLTNGEQGVKTREEISYAISFLLSDINSEQEKSIVKEELDSLSYIIGEVGRDAMIGEHPDLWRELILQFLNGKAQCQVNESGDCDEDEDEHDELMDVVLDNIEQLAKVYNEDFAGVWEILLKPISKFLSKKSPSSDKVMALGTYAEVCSALRGASAKFFDLFMGAFTAALQSQIAGIKSNGIYGIGVLVTVCPAESQKFLKDIFSNVVSWIQSNKGEGTVHDNAIGLLCRVIVTYNEPQEQLDQAFDLVVKGLPLKIDYLEYLRVYSAFEKYMTTRPAKISGEVLNVICTSLVTGLVSRKVDSEVRAKAVAMTRHLSSVSEDVRRFLESRSATEKATMLLHLNGG